MRTRTAVAGGILALLGIGFLLYQAVTPARVRRGTGLPAPIPFDRAVSRQPPPTEDPSILHPNGPRPDYDPARGWRFGDNWYHVFSAGPVELKAACGECHAVPAPHSLRAREWDRVMGEMTDILKTAGKSPDEILFRRIRAFYVENAPEQFAPLPAAESPGAPAFARQAVGKRPLEARVANVNVADLDGDGAPELLVCDGGANAVLRFRRTGEAWAEDVLAECPAAGHTAVVDADRDGDLDVAVAGLGNYAPSDDPTGYVSILVNEGGGRWTRRDLAQGLPRVADVEPADFDGDGDMDYVVAAFGWRKTGFIAVWRNDGATWTRLTVSERPGAIHVPVADLDADGRPDFVALVAQESETITAWLNRGSTFEPVTLFEARNPLYGSSGLELVDLDRDGDLDVLFTNGDSLDDPQAPPRPYHGVQWLENKGKLAFEWREIGRCYGPYRAVASDLDGDGDLDVAVAVLFGPWSDPGAAGLLWYENDGAQNFARHDVPASPSHLITLDAADLDGDGADELVTGRMVVGAFGAPGDGLLRWKITRPK
ncbi:MAG: VCBS repeat-containing protein [Planctomycetes bacterium]|nr:VCBS repeat-containing protein [Planctomycetota bacterium]